MIITPRIMHNEATVCIALRLQLSVCLSACLSVCMSSRMLMSALTIRCQYGQLAKTINFIVLMIDLY